MTSLLSALALGLAATTPVLAQQGQRGGWWRGQGQSAGSPEYTEKFQHPLYNPDVAQIAYSEEIDGRTIDYYELSITNFTQQIYPNLGPAHLVGFNGTTPGPTFWVERGHETVVRITNDHDMPSNVHLHGSPNHAVWDGWANDLIDPGQYKDYYFPNYESARPIWYHGHRDQHTANDAYEGQAGVYMIYDPEEDKLGLPSGNYDTLLIISDKRYQEDGNIAWDDREVMNVFGDIIQVNERPWPYKNVEPRKYRLRLFDMSLSRPYDLYFEDPDGEWIDFKVIASDAGLLRNSIDSNDVTISPGERYEVVIDFAGYEGKDIYLKNKLQMNQVNEFDSTNDIMKFTVGDKVSDTTNNGDVPEILNDNIAFPPDKGNVDRVFNFQMGGDDVWTINGVSFDNVNNRVLAKPPQGTVELWEFRHTGGPSVHPVHVHLVAFQVISREGGRRGLLPYESAGLKDVVLLEPGEVVQALAYFGPWNGLYMFHCHNLIHEDNAMMAAFNVSRLELLGYEDYDVNLADPMGSKYSAKDQPAPEPVDAVRELAALHAYKDPYGLKAAQKSYYAEHGGYPAATPTGQQQGGPPMSFGDGFAVPHNFAGPTPAPNYNGRNHWFGQPGSGQGGEFGGPPGGDQEQEGGPPSDDGDSPQGPPQGQSGPPQGRPQGQNGPPSGSGGWGGRGGHGRGGRWGR